MLGAKVHVNSLQTAAALLPRRPRCLQCRAGKGFGKQAPPAPTPPAKQKPKPKKKQSSGLLEDAKTNKQAEAYADALKLAKAFRETDDKTKFALAQRDRLSPEFFHMVDSHIKQAKPLGHVANQLDLTATLEAAFVVKSSQLRPEIRLVNQLLRTACSAEERRELLRSEESLETLRLNDRYVLDLLDNMTEDAQQQRASSLEDREAVIAQLREIKQECLARLAEGEAQETQRQQEQEQAAVGS